jgi:hypothetical protein
MSNPGDAAGQLALLVAERKTGCLTIDSADGRLCRVYLVMGKIFHAEGPGTEGEPALAEAIGWPDVTLSFDDRAHLPSKQTIDVNVATTGVMSGIEIRPLGETSSSSPIPSVQVRLIRKQKGGAASSGGSQTVERLSDDPRIAAMSCTSLGGGCLMIAVPLLLIGIAALLSSRGINSDGFATAAVLSIPILLVIWIAVFIGLRVIFFRDAVKISNDSSDADIPLVVDAAGGVISGDPELVIKMRVRCTVGKLGRCRIELYADGLQIWKGPQSPVPRWQFAYRDLVQIEDVDLVSNGRFTSHQYFVRLITAQPRMAFLIGNPLLRNEKTQLLLQKLREHHVPTVAESIES